MYSWIKCRLLERAVNGKIFPKWPPLKKSFSFELSDLKNKLSQEAVEYIPRIGDEPFFVRVKRRGYKGRIHSLELEREISSFLVEGLERAGITPHVSFARAEKMLLIDIFPNRCGLGLITREMCQKYNFVKKK